jgi:acetyltransferase-like isoleucine patch superfamily enzyme
MVVAQLRDLAESAPEPDGGLLNTLELAEGIRKLYAELDEKLRSEFRRSLPLQDALLDRWERAQRLGFQKGASVYNSALVFGDVTVGEHTWIGPYVILDAHAASLRIGRYCSIGAAAHIYTHDTVQWALSGGAAPKRVGAVSIEDCVYVGPQSIIASGVQIGRQSVIGANSLVSEDVEPRTVVGGSPARCIGRVVGEGRDITLEFDNR